MTAFLPTTRVTVARPTGAADTWGDDLGGVQAVHGAVPASVTELAQSTYLGTEDRGGQVETYTVRVRPGTDVQEGDQLTTTEGLVLQVEQVATPPKVAGLGDVRCTARRVT